MSANLPELTAREMLRALRKLGWEIDRQSGSHTMLKHAEKPGTVVVPAH